MLLRGPGPCKLAYGDPLAIHDPPRKKIVGRDLENGAPRVTSDIDAGPTASSILVHFYYLVQRYNTGTLTETIRRNNPSYRKKIEEFSEFAKLYRF